MAREITDLMTAQLDRDRGALARSGTADRVAALLRERIMEGLVPPGTRLSEEAIGRALGISRNTLREAFRLLCHEGVAVHQLNRGIFVPVLGSADVVDIYAVRRLVEGGAVRQASSASDSARSAVVAAAEEGTLAADARRWLDFRTADLHFHLAIAGLAGSPRVDELMRKALTELRLVFHAMPDPADFHTPFVARNREIAELVAAGNGRAAHRELMQYFAEAEQQILTVYAAAEESTAVAR